MDQRSLRLYIYNLYKWTLKIEKIYFVWLYIFLKKWRLLNYATTWKLSNDYGKDYQKLKLKSINCSITFTFRIDKSIICYYIVWNL